MSVWIFQDVNEIVAYSLGKKSSSEYKSPCADCRLSADFWNPEPDPCNPEILRQRYGLEVVKLPFTSIFKYMDESQMKKQDQLQKRSSMVLQIPR